MDSRGTAAALSPVCFVSLMPMTADFRVERGLFCRCKGTRDEGVAMCLPTMMMSRSRRSSVSAVRWHMSHATLPRALVQRRLSSGFPLCWHRLLPSLGSGDPRPFPFIEVRTLEGTYEGCVGAVREEHEGSSWSPWFLSSRDARGWTRPWSLPYPCSCEYQHGVVGARVEERSSLAERGLPPG